MKKILQGSYRLWQSGLRPRNRIIPIILSYCWN